MKKLAIFDLDGTLLDSICDIAKACNMALQDAGLQPHPVEVYKKMVGNGVKKLIDRAVPEEFHGTETYDKVYNKYTMEYNLVCMDGSTMFAGTRPLLEKLKNDGVAVAIATNKPDEMSRNIIKSTLPEGLVDAVYGQRADLPAKPDPTVVKMIMEQFSASADETIYIGDSNVDIFTAQNAGVKSVGVTWGFRERQELIEAGADMLIDNFDDLYTEIIKK